MKTFKSVMVAIMVVLWVVSISDAASSANLTMSAQVPNSSPELTLVIKELTQANQDPWTGTTVTTMNFGQLTHILADGSDAGVWYSPKYYCVFIFTTSYGHQYEVKSTCAGVTSGSNTLPAGSFGLTPAYAAADEWSPGNPQGTRPTGSTLGTAGPAVATGKLIYRSETAATNRILRAFYSLPCYLTGGGDPFAGYTPITTSQAPGTYSTTVTITIAAI